MSNLLSPPLPSPQIKRQLRFEGGKNHRQSALLPKKNESPLFIFRAGSFARLIRQTAEEAEKLTCGGELHVR
jgi:hypothetical protein